MSNFKEVYNKLGELAETLSGRVINYEDHNQGWIEGFHENRSGTWYTFPFTTLIPTLHVWNQSTLSYYPSSLLDPISMGYETYQLSGFLSWGAQESQSLTISILNKSVAQIYTLFEVTFYIDDGYGRYTETITKVATIAAQNSTSIECTVPSDAYDWKVDLWGVYIDG